LQDREKGEEGCGCDQRPRVGKAPRNRQANVDYAKGIGAPICAYALLLSMVAHRSEELKAPVRGEHRPPEGAQVLARPLLDPRPVLETPIQFIEPQGTQG